ncbi:ABC-2 type transport system ATP-binding protein [Priestia aryabhattai]|uniref:ABC transporter ATP-binding protein n=1 Tax=Priestia aryabhattai TaxID=412384 RepID=UPI0027E567C0|nr:ABC transporter ATP-binding protein [Priestia aryabhattai]MDP9726515.1 ABC-2 type transport system ATP-binding protein [Priestia aryabhattai]
MLALETHNLTKSYYNHTVVDNINLSVKQGDVFGFLGRNGAGKSTFINMVTGITLPTSGTYKIFGLNKDSGESFYNKIGVLPDYSTFYEDLNPIQHLDYFSKILGANKSKKELVNLLERVGLGDAVHVKSKKFSFGMKKKLGIAQAIVHDPELVFLDEPTSGVDADSVLNIHSIIEELAYNGKTIFLTSHNLDEIQKLCNQISIMAKGKIKCQGTMEELRKQHQTQIQVEFKHSPIKGESNKQSLKQLFNKIGSNVTWEEDYTLINVKDETDIPILNRALAKMNVDVYRVQVKELSLEEIFLGVNKKERSA